MYIAFRDKSYFRELVSVQKKKMLMHSIIMQERIITIQFNSMSYSQHNRSIKKIFELIDS